MKNKLQKIVLAGMLLGMCGIGAGDSSASSSGGYFEGLSIISAPSSSASSSVVHPIVASTPLLSAATTYTTISSAATLSAGLVTYIRASAFSILSSMGRAAFTTASAAISFTSTYAGLRSNPLTLAEQAKQEKSRALVQFIEEEIRNALTEEGNACAEETLKYYNRFFNIFKKSTRISYQDFDENKLRDCLTVISSRVQTEILSDETGRDNITQVFFPECIKSKLIIYMLDINTRDRLTLTEEHVFDMFDIRGGRKLVAKYAKLISNRSNAKSFRDFVRLVDIYCICRYM